MGELAGGGRTASLPTVVLGMYDASLGRIQEARKLLRLRSDVPPVTAEDDDAQ